MTVLALLLMSATNPLAMKEVISFWSFGVTTAETVQVLGVPFCAVTVMVLEEVRSNVSGEAGIDVASGEMPKVASMLLTGVL